MWQLNIEKDKISLIKPAISSAKEKHNFFWKKYFVAQHFFQTFKFIHLFVR